MLARHVISFSFRCIVGLMRVMGVFRYEITGIERLERHGLLILANHPTLIDIVFLMAFVKRADCIVKSRLWRNPFTHATVRAAAYVRNDDYGVQLIEDCVAAVRRGGNLIIFPEGTRTPNMAQSSSSGARRILRCEASAMSRRCLYAACRRCWSREKSGGGCRIIRRAYSIEVQEDIDMRPFITEAGSELLAARRLTDYLQDYFTKEKPSWGRLRMK